MKRTAIVVCVGCLAVVLSRCASAQDHRPSEVLFRRALQEAPQRQNELLIEAANRGSAAALARLVELHEVVRPEVFASLNLAGQSFPDAQIHSGIRLEQAKLAVRAVQLQDRSHEAGEELRAVADDLAAAAREASHPVLRELATRLQPELAGELLPGIAERWIEASEGRDARVTGWFLYKAATAYLAAREPNFSQTRCEQAIARLRQVGDSLGEAYAVHFLGWILTKKEHPNWNRARDLFDKAGRLFAARGATRQLATATYERGFCTVPGRAEGGSWAAAAAAYQRAAVLYERVGDVEGQAKSLASQADCIVPDRGTGGSWSEAAQLYASAAQAARKAGHKKYEGVALLRQGVCVIWEGALSRFERASALFSSATELLREVGDRRLLADALYYRGQCQLQLGRRSAGARDLKEARNLAIAEEYDELIPKINAALAK